MELTPQGMTDTADISAILTDPIAAGGDSEPAAPAPKSSSKTSSPAREAGTPKKRRGSLKYKLLALLVTLPLFSLSLYLMLATSLFKSDKLAYVFDSTSMAVRGAASRAKLEIQNEVQSLTVIVEEFDERSRSFGSGAKAQFQRSPSILAARVYRMRSDRSADLQGNLARPEKSLEGDLEEALKKSFQDDKTTKELIKRASDQGGMAFGKPASGPADLVQLVRLWGKDGKHVTHAVVGWVRLQGLERAFGVVSTYSGFLADTQGRVLFGPDATQTRGEKVQTFADWKFFSDLKARKVNDGTVEVPSPDGNARLASYSQVGWGDLVAVGLVRKKEALKAVDILLYKSIIFFVALISFSVMTSVFASGKLTSTLRLLYTATEKVSSGDFNIDVKVQSNDEVGSLAESFNRMAAKISELLKETADKARMEKELETAKTVQETLFPTSKFELGKVKLAGVYQSASECGGDWWYHCVIEGKIFLWIGDATGHGVPAALLTSAARSAATIIERLPDITPAKAMKYLNSSIHHGAKGKMMMTFFIASIDTETGEVLYANASHDSPYLLRDTTGKLTKKNVEPLNDVNSPRLGELADYDYEDCKVQLEPGDAIFFYTDGVPDVQNPEGVAWGQKNFMKNILSSASNNTPADEAVEKMRSEAMGYRQNTELPDDVTFILCKYNA